MISKVVQQIGQIHFEGNIVPMSWFNHIKFENGKPHIVAILLLSEIIYWYRPVEIRDELTGQLTGYRKKFKADKWQRNYQSLADQFGFGKRQVKDAIDYLEERRLITREFRHFTTKAGMGLSNVMYIEPVPEEIAKITYRGMGASFVQTEDGLRSNGTSPSPERKTYTETPTETSTGEGNPMADLPDVEKQLAVLFPRVEEAGVASPDDDAAAWLHYREEALKVYHEFTGFYPDSQVGRPAIALLGGEPDFNIQRWADSIKSCKLAGVNPRNIQCMIDTYRNGGDYQELMRKSREKQWEGEAEEPRKSQYVPVWKATGEVIS